MKILVTVASKYGATAEIGARIAEVLTARGHDTVSIDPADVRSVEDAGAVVLGSAVYAGRWQKSAKELVGRIGAECAALPVWLFSSGPVGDPAKPEEDPVDVAEIAEALAPRDHRVFAGKIVKKQLSFPERAIVAALKVPEGDFRDWAEIEAWANEIADSLNAG